MSHNFFMKNFGDRLKAVRSFLLNLSRKEFAQKVGMPEITIRQWETGKTHITPSSSKRLWEALLKEQVPISKEWLLEGAGISPFGNQSSIPNGLSEQEVFLSLNPKAIVFEVPDASNEPLFEKGDLIGAFSSDPKNIQSMSFILLESKEGTKSIKKIVLTEEGLLYFLPVIGCQFSKAIVYKPSMKIYKIIWYKKSKQEEA